MKGSLGCFWLLWSCLVQASTALQWIHSDSVADGKAVPVCQGQNVTLAWKYKPQLDVGEHVVNVEWHYKDKYGSPEGVLATAVNGNFIREVAIIQHLEFLPNAGIRVLNVTDKDMGTYSVHVQTNLNGSFVTHVQSVTVFLSANNVTEKTLLRADIAGAMFLNSSQQYHLLLSCGNFNPDWASSTHVVWTTPTEQILPSTFTQNGQFFLAVPNPILTGDYGCTVDNSSPSLSCIPSDSPTRWGAFVHVTAVEGRQLVMESKVQAMEEKLISRIQRLEMDKTRLQGHVHSLTQQLEARTKDTDQIKDCQTSLQTNTTQLSERVDLVTTLIQTVDNNTSRHENQLQSLLTSNTQLSNRLQSLASLVQILQRDRNETGNLLQELQTNSTNSVAWLQTLREEVYKLCRNETHTEEEVQSLRELVKNLTSYRLTQTLVDVRDLQSNSSFLQERFNNLTGVLQALENRSVSTDNTLQNVLNNYTASANRLEMLTKQTLVLQNRTFSVEYEVKELQNITSNGQYLLQTLQTDSAKTKQQIGMLQTNTTHLAELANTAFNQTKALKNKDTAIENALKLLQENSIRVLQNLNSTEQELNTFRNNVTTVLGETRIELDALKNQSPNMTLIKDQMQAVEMGLHDLQAAWKNGSKRVDELGNMLNRLESSVQSLQVSSVQDKFHMDALVEEYRNLSLAFQKDHRPVSFYARLMLSPQRDHVPSGQPIIFFDVVTNEGDAYNPTTGQFTAPISGVYHFHLNIMATNGSAYSGSVRADVMVDDVWTALAITADNQGQHDMGSADVIVRLRTGQRVWVRNKWECVYGPSATTISGSLVRADIG